MNSADSRTPIRIPRDTFASMVTERLRESIVKGERRPGSQLSEVELADAFGVSRGPVREAFQRLIQEGLLKSEPHRGVFIPVLTKEDFADVYLARDALESGAVRHIIRTSRAAEAYAALDVQVTAMERAEREGDWEAVGQLDLQFHTVLVASTGSERLQRMFKTVITETRVCLRVLTVAEARDDLVSEHRTVCDSIRDGDIRGALTALKKHFDDAVVTLTDAADRDSASDGS